jgi:hypothetical protein
LGPQAAAEAAKAAKAAAEQRRRMLGLEGTATDAECEAAEVRWPLVLADMTPSSSSPRA